MAFTNYIPIYTSRHACRATEPRHPIPRATTAATGATTSVSTPTPLADRILVRVDEKSNQSTGGLFLTESGKSKSSTGTVIAVGPGRFSPEGVREGIDFYQPGDKVLWKDEFGAETVQTESGESFLALRAFSVVAKFN